METKLAGRLASPCAALSVTVSGLIFAKAWSGGWRRDPIWTESQRSLSSILWVEYFDRVPGFWVLLLIIAVIVVLIVFATFFFFFFFNNLFCCCFPSHLLFWSLSWHFCLRTRVYVCIVLPLSDEFQSTHGIAKYPDTVKHGAYFFPSVPIL